MIRQPARSASDGSAPQDFTRRWRSGLVEQAITVTPASFLLLPGDVGDSIRLQAG